MGGKLSGTERIMTAAALVCAALTLGLYLGSGASRPPVVTTAEAAVSQTSAPAARGLIDLNTAGEEELMLLPGIGEKRAAAIVRYREENGAFSEISDIMEVEDIGPGIFEDIRNYITVGDKA